MKRTIPFVSSMRRDIHFILPFLYIILSHYSSQATKHNHHGGERMIMVTPLTFTFQVEGYFNSDKFGNLQKQIISSIQNDIKRKYNKDMKNKGHHNYTAGEIDFSSHYIEANEVNCVNQRSCETSSNQNVLDCEAISCEMAIHHDIQTAPLEVQTKTLAILQQFFRYKKVDEIDNMVFIGPFVKETQLQIKIIGVSPFLMNTVEIRTFERSLLQFLFGMQKHQRNSESKHEDENSWIQVRSVKVIDQFIHKHIETSSASSSGGLDDIDQDSGLLPSNCALYVTVDIHSFHQPKLKDRFDFQLKDYIENGNVKFVGHLKASGQVYFSNTIYAKTSLSPLQIPHLYDGVTSGAIFVKGNEMVRMDFKLALGIIFLFIFVLLPALSFIGFTELQQ